MEVVIVRVGKENKNLNNVKSTNQSSVMDGSKRRNLEMVLHHPSLRTLKLLRYPQMMINLLKLQLTTLEAWNNHLIRNSKWNLRVP